MAMYQPAITWSQASEICKIPKVEIRDGITLYVIELHVFPYTWIVKHRFSDFSDLHDKLVEFHQLDKSLLPPKKLFGTHAEAFILKRQNELELYLQTLLHRFNNLPIYLREFLDFSLYEIKTVIENLSEKCFIQGDALLSNGKPFQFTPFELHAITERLKLAEPTCGTGIKKQDLGHLLSFITQLQHLKIVGCNSRIGTSNIIPNNLTFNLTPFKSLTSLEIFQCKLNDTLQTTEPVLKTVTNLMVHNTLNDLSNLLLSGNMYWQPDDPFCQWPYWQNVIILDLSHNYLTYIHPCVKLLPLVETIDLSHNNIHQIENLESLPRLHSLNLSYNKIQNLEKLHTRLGNIRTLIFTGNGIECLQGFSRLYSLVELHLNDNNVSAMSEVNYIGKLPCLEKLNLCNNPISSSVDYRAHVLLAFETRASELQLDDLKTSEKEVDTVAVLHALQVAKKEQFSSESYQKLSSSEKDFCCTTAHTVYSCVEFKRVKRMWGRSSSVSKFRHEVTTLRKHGGSNWLRLLNQVLNKSSENELPSAYNEISEAFTGNGQMEQEQNRNLRRSPVTKASYTSADIVFPESMFTTTIAKEVVKEHLYNFLSETAKEEGFLQSLPHLLDFLWLVYVMDQCISVTQIPVCLALFPTQIVVSKVESMGDTHNLEKSSVFPFIPKVAYLKSFPISSISSFVIGPRKAYIELHVQGVAGIQKHLFFMPNCIIAEDYIQKLQEVHGIVPSLKRDPFIQDILDVEILRSDENFVLSAVECKLLFCERVILLEVSYCCSFDSIHYLSVTPSHLILIEEMLPFVMQPQFHVCTVVNIQTNVQDIHVGRDTFSFDDYPTDDETESAMCAKSDDTSQTSTEEAEMSGPCVFVEFATNIVLNIRFLCFEDQNRFLETFLKARSVICDKKIH